MPKVRTYATMSLDRSDLDEVVAIFEGFIKDVLEKDNGTLLYEYYIDDDPLLIHVFEEYEDGQAHLDHYAHLNMEAAGRLLGLVKLSDPHYFGLPTPAEQELLAGFGNVHYHRPLVSIADTTPQL